METDILTDEQIEQLLQDAEERLRRKAGLPAIDASVGEISLAETRLPSSKRKPLPKLKHNLDGKSYIQEVNGLAQTRPEAIVRRDEQKLANQLQPLNGLVRGTKVNDQLTAGSEWFDLPKTTLTPQLKRDLQLIEMRSVLDPHRHYKKNNRKGKVPTFSQVGTVIEGPTEWYSSRLNKKDRAKNFVEEAMSSEQQTGRFKRKYKEIQDSKTSGKKAHYKKLMAKRTKKP